MDIANGQDAVPAAGSDRRPVREQALSPEQVQSSGQAQSSEQTESSGLTGSAGQAPSPEQTQPSENDVPGVAGPGGYGDASTGEDTAGRGTGAQRGKVRRVRVLLAVAAAVYALDMVSKALVAAKMHYGQPIRLLGSVLELDYTRNSGAAFSIGTTYTFIFTAIAVGVIVVILRLARSLFSLPWAIALGLLLGGALGNLTDRIVRAPGVFRGWVVDFIHVPHWPIFNLADSAICVGGALMVLLAFRGLHPDGTDERAEAARSGSGAKPSDAGSNGSNGAAS
jgi:signal peptidase II